MYPILFEFGPITIFSRWLFIAIGFALASFLFSRLAKRHRIKFDILSEHSIFLFFAALGLSRIFFIATHPDLYFTHFSLKMLFGFFEIWDKGLSFWGAVSGFIGGIYWISSRKESPISLIDLMIPPAFLGIALGSFGAFLDGANYGKPTVLPWGVTFLNANVKYITPIHPTQLYALFYALALGIFLYRLLEYLRDSRPGFVTELGILGYSFFRFAEEFFRGDETIEIFSLRLPQIMAFLGIIGGAYFLWKRFRGGTAGGFLQNLKTIANTIWKSNRAKPLLSQRPEVKSI